jgi:hypothetical protein
MPEGRNALLIKEYLWPNGVVPYVFHPDYSKLLLKDQWERKRRPYSFHFWQKQKLFVPVYFISTNYIVNAMICHAANNEMCLFCWLPSEGIILRTVCVMVLFFFTVRGNWLHWRMCTAVEFKRFNLWGQSLLFDWDKWHQITWILDIGYTVSLCSTDSSVMDRKSMDEFKLF